ncbi:hypothetical protein J7F01_06700 [Streptomyces sp. ISL-22]|uniref:hypothetical protein n=1 Tax=Streptomyces sp. ISL-22 TaxID=2819180 RepID=UPI001BEA71F6|nr:hypothetical protein [Streptomyces sp. ISL-22]MBT2431890.1 hypothetical protein [Streptomyces sp. ISL-22]
MKAIKDQVAVAAEMSEQSWMAAMGKLWAAPPPGEPRLMARVTAGRLPRPTAAGTATPQPRPRNPVQPMMTKNYSQDAPEVTNELRKQYRAYTPELTRVRHGTPRA